MNIAEQVFEAIVFEDKDWLIHPFRAKDFDRFDYVAEQVLKVLSDEETLRFLPEKRLSSSADAHTWLQKAVLNFHSRKNYTHFISEKKTGNLVGMIDILSPNFIKEYYRLHDYPYFIEFYLIGSAQGQLIMSSLLPGVIWALREQGISNIAAVVNRKNFASIRVLEKAGFTYCLKLDVLQDLFKIA